MPYEIKHKSRDVCLIQYVKPKRFGRNLRIDLLVVVLGLISLFVGIPVVLILSILVLYAFYSHEVKPHPLPEFEIELNKAENQIFIRNSEPPQKRPITYPLSNFRGFGIQETPYKDRSKNLFQAELYFKMEPIRGMPRDIPLRNQTYLVSPKNAEHIVKEINEWLKPDKIQQLKDPAPEAEIIRDFRGMDKSESGPD